MGTRLKIFHFEHLKKISVYCMVMFSYCLLQMLLNSVIQCGYEIFTIQSLFRNFQFLGGLHRNSEARITDILAHQIEKSNVLPHVRNSYLTLVISPRRTLRSSVLF